MRNNYFVILLFLIIVFVFNIALVYPQNVADTVTSKNPLLIDTNLRPNQSNVNIDSTNIRIDTNFVPKKEIRTLTNVKVLIYTILSLTGLALFYFIFINTLFRTFHKKRSTRQSMMLSWSLFFNVSVLWIFIVWGIVGELWNISSFVVIVAFLFVISLITLAFALKSK
jgi:hypothetical protein